MQLFNDKVSGMLQRGGGKSGLNWTSAPGNRESISAQSVSFISGLHNIFTFIIQEIGDDRDVSGNLFDGPLPDFSKNKRLKSL